VKIYVAAMEALKKNERLDETQCTTKIDDGYWAQIPKVRVKTQYKGKKSGGWLSEEFRSSIRFSWSEPSLMLISGVRSCAYLNNHQRDQH
jgi:hypothetical protein